MKIEIKFWSITGLGILGLGLLAVSLALGYAAATHYEKILSTSLKYGAESIALFSICLAFSESKKRWIFLIPIGIQLVNHFQAVNRLTHLLGD